MSTPRRSLKLSPARLRNAFVADLAAAWTSFRQRHPDHTPYAVVLYGTEDPIRLSPHILTEQGLTQVAQRYLEERYYDTLDEARAALRYSVADSPLIDEFDVCPDLDALIEPIGDALHDTGGYSVLAKPAIAAFRQLDEQGLFGRGADRERLVLVMITEDTDWDWTTKSARQLNPKPVFQRFQDQTKIEGTFASCDALAVSPDGACIYSGGSRKNPAGKPGSRDEFISEIIACDLRDARLFRRWAFTLPSFGDSCRALACTPNGTAILALRAQYSGDARNTLLMRFRSDSNEPVRQHTIAGAPAAFALSPDGARVAVALPDQMLHVLDSESFHLLHSRKLDARARGLRFLRSGELLAATDGALLRLDPGGDTAAASVSLASSHLAVDDAEQLLAVSRWFPWPDQPGYGYSTEFGVHLLHLPSLALARTFLVPGHESVQATLSRDGRLIAFRASEIGTDRHFVVVFDTATGQEVSRRKSDRVGDLAFLSDNRTLAIATSGYTTSEPIDLWSLSHPA